MKTEMALKIECIHVSKTSPFRLFKKKEGISPTEYREKYSLN